MYTSLHCVELSSMLPSKWIFLKSFLNLELNSVLMRQLYTDIVAELHFKMLRNVSSNPIIFLVAESLENFKEMVLLHYMFLSSHSVDFWNQDSISLRFRSLLRTSIFCLFDLATSSFPSLRT